MIVISKKYKTMLCKHFMQNGKCHLGTKCNFAHGEKELRNQDDPMPIINEKPSIKLEENYQMAAEMSNFKTVKCKYFMKGISNIYDKPKGNCKYGLNCNFAHGNNEIRTTGSPLPHNLFSPNDGNESLLGNQVFESLQNQIAQQQISYLISQMQEYHNNDIVYMKAINQASEENLSGDVQGAASILYNLINRIDKSKEDEQQYTIFIEAIQHLGNNLLKEVQSKLKQRTNQLSQPDIFSSNNGISLNGLSYSNQANITEQIMTQNQVIDPYIYYQNIQHDNQLELSSEQYPPSMINPNINNVITNQNIQLMNTNQILGNCMLNIQYTNGNQMNGQG